MAASAGTRGTDESTVGRRRGHTARTYIAAFALAAACQGSPSDSSDHATGGAATPAGMGATGPGGRSGNGGSGTSGVAERGGRGGSSGGSGEKSGSAGLAGRDALGGASATGGTFDGMGGAGDSSGGDGGSSGAPDGSSGAANGGDDTGGSMGTGGTADFPCGRPGEPCCPVEGCLDGGCCSGNPWYRCVPPGQSCDLAADDICAEGSCGACGGLDEPCCSARSCSAPHSVCRTEEDDPGGHCVRCGGENEPCCRNGACDAGLGCDQSEETPLCTTCGEPGQACCSGNVCDDGGCCADGRCEASGGNCIGWVSGAATEAGLCEAGACADCGFAGEPCCLGTTLFCIDPGTTCGADGSTISPECETCGGPGQICCPGDVCLDGGCCLGVGDALRSVCFAEGETCSNQGGVCDEGRCSDCGRAGQSCCSFSRCYDTACADDECQ